MNNAINLFDALLAEDVLAQQQASALDETDLGLIHEMQAAFDEAVMTSRAIIAAIPSEFHTNYLPRRMDNDFAYSLKRSFLEAFEKLDSQLKSAEKNACEMLKDYLQRRHGVSFGDVKNIPLTLDLVAYGEALIKSLGLDLKNVAANQLIEEATKEFSGPWESPELKNKCIIFPRGFYKDSWSEEMGESACTRLRMLDRMLVYFYTKGTHSNKPPYSFRKPHGTFILCNAEITTFKKGSAKLVFNSSADAEAFYKLYKLDKS